MVAKRTAGIIIFFVGLLVSFLLVLFFKDRIVEILLSIVGRLGVFV